MPNPRALVTGITGQDGLYLAELLLAKGYEVHGVIRGQNNPRRELVEQLVPDVHLHNGDLTDMSSLMRALTETQPDEVYNLGAISFVAYSWENAALTTDVTAKGVLTMLEALRLHTGDDPGRVRFYQASIRIVCSCSSRASDRTTEWVSELLPRVPSRALENLEVGRFCGP